MKKSSFIPLALATVLGLSGLANLTTITTYATGDGGSSLDTPAEEVAAAEKAKEAEGSTYGLEDYLDPNFSSGKTALTNLITDKSIAVEKVSDKVYNLTLLKEDGITLTKVDSSIRFTNGVVVNLNLNGHNLTGAVLLDVANATLNITGTGTISAKGASVGDSSSTIRVYGNETTANKSALTIGSGVTIGAAGDQHYGVSVFAAPKNNRASYGVNVEISGKVESDWGVASNGTINESDAVITIKDGAEITAASKELAIYAAGLATWNIGAATLNGGSGIGIKAGTLNLTGTTINAGMDYIGVNLWNNGINANGSVFQIEDNNAYADTVHITINGGTYTASGDGGYVFFEYNDNLGSNASSDPQDRRLQKLTINSGQFEAKSGNIIKLVEGNEDAVSINGGTFVTSSSDQVNFLSEHLTSNHYLSGTSGQYIVRTISSGSSSTSTTNNTVTSSDSTTGTVAASDASTNVQITANSQDVAAGSKLVVTDVKTSAQVVKQVASDESLLGAFDFKLVAANGNAITTFSRGVTVRVPVSRSYAQAKNLYARYVNDKGEVPESDISATIVKLNSKYYAEFNVKHFSTYMLVKTDNPKVVASAPTTGETKPSTNQSQPSVDKPVLLPNAGVVDGSTSAAANYSWMLGAVVVAGFGITVMAIRKAKAARAEEE